MQIVVRRTLTAARLRHRGAAPPEHVCNIQYFFTVHFIARRVQRTCACASQGGPTPGNDQQQDQNARTSLRERGRTRPHARAPWAPTHPRTVGTGSGRERSIRAAGAAVRLCIFEALRLWRIELHDAQLAFRL